jgi:hypothetical protein
MAHICQDYGFDYGIQALAQPSNDQVLLDTAESAQLLSHDSLQLRPNPDSHLSNQMIQAYQHGNFAAALPSQQQQQSLGSNTSHTGLACDYPEVHQMYASNSSSNIPVPFELALQIQRTPMHLQTFTNSSYLLSIHSPSVQPGELTQGRQHCRLPEHSVLSKLGQTGGGDGLHVAEEDLLLSVVGDPGMPEPAIRPKGPKLKFSPEDDALLVELKETKNLTWKQIADFFPGRSSGTLQIRYCTKLKAKETILRETMVNRCSLWH